MRPPAGLSATCSGAAAVPLQVHTLSSFLMAHAHTHSLSLWFPDVHKPTSGAAMLKSWPHILL